MQFVILKDEYEVDEYGIEIKRENPPEFKDLKPAMKVINEYVTTGEFGVEGRQAGDKNVVYIDESEVPEDIRNALKAAYVAQKKFLSLRPKAKKEDVSKLETERDEAFKPLREISHREELTLTEFVQEFLNCIPDEIKKEMQKNGYKVTTNFSESDYSCYEEYARINAKELRISRKKVAAEDEETVNGCNLGYSKKITYASDAAALNLRTKLLKENSKPLSVPWTGEHYIRKSSKAGKPVMTVFDEYSISFYGILKKEYAQLLARLFLNTSGAMQKVQLSYAKQKLHKKTYSIQ